MRTKGIGTIASFGIITFGLISTFLTVHSLILPPAPASAEPSYATSSEVGINVKESIKIAVDKDHLALVDGEGSTQIAPSASGTLVTGDVNVAVTTNAYGGYRLGVYTSDATTDMKHNNDSVNAVVSSIAGASGYDATTGLASLSPNTWGFRKYTEASNVGGNEIPASWSNWHGVGNNSTNMAIIDIKDVGEGPSTYCNDLSQPVAESGCISSSYDTYKVGFGANLTSSLPAGTYTNNIIFSALTNEASTFLTFNANAPSGTTVSGSMAPKSILKGSIVTLPDTTTFKRDGFGIKGWALTEGATTVASITQPDPSNPGSTINVQLTPGATVDVDSLISAIGIPSSTTGPIPLYAVWDNAYTINYIANNPEGTTVTGNTPASTAILGLNTTIETNNYEIDGYTLKGWAFTSNAEDPASISEVGAKDLISGATFTTQQLITAAASAGQSVSTSTAGTITLYAVWEQDGYGEDTMQGWTGCANLAPSASVMLTDARDGKEYAVKKLPDGKCWMMQNLTINGVELTPEDTNIADGNTYYLPKDGGAGSLTDPATKDATTGFNFAEGYDNQAMFKFRSKNTSYTNDSDTGYYNFYTATLGYSYSNDGKSSGTATQDICPANWRMPRVTDAGPTIYTVDANNDFTYLVRQYTTAWNGTATDGSYYTADSNATTSMYAGAASPLATSTDNNYAGFSYSGYWKNTGSSASDVGSDGYYWSASIAARSSYSLYFYLTSHLGPQNRRDKQYGYAVRCVNNHFGYMQDFDSSSLASGASAILKDSRDDQTYSVYRVPTNATYPGASTTANVAGKVIMTKDLNLGAVDSVPGSASTIVANGTMTLSPEDSGFTEPTGTNYEGITIPTTSVTISNKTGNWDTSNDNYTNKQYTTSGSNSYSGRGYYSWGAAMTVCPKGWRLPTDVEYNNNSSSYNASTTGISKLVNNSIATIQYPPYSFTLGGYYYGNFYGSESYGYYWSSTQYSSSVSYDLYMNSSYGLVLNNSGYKYNGFAVRCITD